MAARMHSRIQFLSRSLGALTFGVAMAIPASFFAYAYRHIEGLIDAQTALLVPTLSNEVATAPDLWRFRTAQLQVIVESQLRAANMRASNVRIYDADGGLVIEGGDTVATPMIVRTSPLYDHGHPNGRVEVRRTLRPVVAETALIGGLVLVLAIAAWRLVTGPARRLQDLLQSLEAERQRALAAEAALRDSNEELERRVDERTSQLRDALARMETYSYSIAHDLRAPLRGIDGYSAMLAEDYGARLDDEGRRILGRLRDSAHAMARLIDGVLGYAQLDQRHFDDADVPLADLVRELVHEQEDLIRNRGVAVDLALEDVNVRGDREGLRIAVRNLLDNALKFTARVASPSVRIDLRREAGRNVLEVRDNGVGFDMRYGNQLFGMFKRLHPGGEYAGSGVGLALVRKVMERMGGTVRAESSPGQGACFRLEMPAPG